MRPILQVFYSIISGLLLSLAIPNEFYLFGNPIFTLLAFIPLYLAFYSVSSYRMAFLLGFLQTITTHLTSSYWLAFFKDFAALTLGASAVGTGFIGGFFGLFLYLPFSSSRNKNKLNEKSLQISFINTPTFRIIYFAAMYTLYEWVKSAGFLGYPWGTISASMFRWPVLMQLSAITGTYGISFIIMILNCIIAELIILNGKVNLFTKLKASKIKKSIDFSKKQKKFLENLKNCPNIQISKDVKKDIKLKLKTQKAQYLLKTEIINNNINYISSLTLGIKTFSIFLILIMAYGITEYYKPRKPLKELTTIMVQQNLDPWSELSDENSILISQDLTSKQLEILQEQGKSPDLVVWSEGCLKRPFPYSESYYSYYPESSPLTEFIKEKHVPFLIGGSYVEEDPATFDEKYYNAALMFDKDGRFRGYYGKNHLVPFAESLPFAEYPAVRAIMEEIIGISAGWYPGDQYVYFELPCKKTENFRHPAVKNINIEQNYWEQIDEENMPETIKFSTPICFDDAFTDVMRPMFKNGAELFINITDDSWSLKESSEIQHFSIAAYRAIEYRTTLVRSANAGYSVVVDPSGKVIHDQPLFKQASTTFDVPVYKRVVTTYARFGNWLPYSIAILFIIYCIYMWKTFKKTDYIPSERKNKKIKY